MKYFVYLLLTLGIGLPLNASTQSPKATMAIENDSIWVGDHIRLSLTVDFPKGGRAYFPIFVDSLMPGLENLQAPTVDTLSTNPRTILCQRFKFISFEAGIYQLPATPVLLINGQQVDTVYANGIEFIVYEPLVDTTLDVSQIKDIKTILKAPLTFKELWPYLLGGLILILLIIGGYILYRRYKTKGHILPERIKPRIPPYQMAIDQMETLRLKQLWQQNLVKEYHTELVEILRQYLLDELEIAALEMTSDEILEAFSQHSIHNEFLTDKLRQILDTADYVKFAKRQPLPDENDLSFKQALQFIERCHEIHQHKLTQSNPEEPCSTI